VDGGGAEGSRGAFGACTGHEPAVGDREEFRGGNEGVEGMAVCIGQPGLES